MAPISGRTRITTLLQREIVGPSVYIVALVDIGASHSFVASKLVQKYNVIVILDTSMVVTLADDSQMETCKCCYMPISTMSNKPVCCVV